MKQSTIIISVAFCLATTLNVSSQPKLTVVGGPSVNFGNVYYAKKVSRDIQILNSGTQMLTITGIETYCSCTKAKITSKSIAPNTNAVLTLTFDPKVFQGNISKAISVKSNDQSAPSTPIMFTAHVFKLLEVNPDYIFFGTFPADSSVTKILKIKNVSPNPLKILRVVPKHPFIAASVRNTTLAKGQETELVVTAAAAPPMTIQGQLELVTNSKIGSKVLVNYAGLATQQK